MNAITIQTAALPGLLVNKEVYGNPVHRVSVDNVLSLVCMNTKRTEMEAITSHYRLE